MTVSGKVTRLSESSYRYVRAGKGTKVRIYFTPGKSGGARKWQGVAYVGTNGTFTKRFKASRSGRWSAVVPVTTRYIQRTRTDYVAVTR